MAEDGVAEDDAAEAGAPAQSAGGAPGIHGAAPIAVAGERTVAATTSGKAQILALTASAAGHLLIALLIVVSLAPFPVTPDAIPVKLVPAEQAPPKPPEKSPEQQAQQKQAQQKPPQEKQAQEKQAPPAKAPPDQKEPEQKAPEQKAQEQKPPEQKPPEQKATEQKTAAEAPAADPAKAASDSGNKPPAPAKDAETPKKAPTPWSDIAASLGMADYGRKTPLAELLLAEIGTAVRRCWTVPEGWSDPHQVSVVLRFQLNPDGSLDGDPAVVEFRATPIGAAAAKAAISAVKQCGPYRLPSDKYDQWQDVQLKLAP